MIPVLILAAGASSRMRGADKMLEPVAGGAPLLRAQTERALATGDPVFVAIGNNQDARHAVLRDLPATVLIVPEAAEGMAGTLRGALTQIAPKGAVMITLADLVLLTTQDLKTLLSVHHRQPNNRVWRAATADGRPGHPIVIADSLRQSFLALSGDTGAQSILSALQDETLLVRLEGQRARFDLDTPEDWAAYRASIS